MTEKESLQIEFLQKAYDNFTLHTSFSFRRTPLLPLDSNALNIARIYCLNNYEISIIQYRYLFYWTKRREKPYITSNYLLQILEVPHKKIFQLLLDVYDDQISYNNFFNFFCIMTFSKIDRLMKLVLSACGIHSNYGVGKDAVESFFTNISDTAMDNRLVNAFMNINDELITVKDLITFAQINEELYNPFWVFRCNLIKFFFNERYSIKAVKRIMFYDKAFDMDLKIPKESCSSKLYRMFIVKEPPPYYTEYRDINTDPKECEELFDLYIVERRKKYGYSKRFKHSMPRSQLSETFSDRNSSCNSKIKSSQKITTTKTLKSFNQPSPTH